MLGKIEDRRSRGQPRIRWLDGITTQLDMNLSKLREIAGDSGAWCAAVRGFREAGTRHGLNTTRMWGGDWQVREPGAELIPHTFMDMD